MYNIDFSSIDTNAFLLAEDTASSQTQKEKSSDIPTDMNGFQPKREDIEVIIPEGLEVEDVSPITNIGVEYFKQAVVENSDEAYYKENVSTFGRNVLITAVVAVILIVLYFSLKKDDEDKI